MNRVKCGALGLASRRLSHDRLEHTDIWPNDRYLMAGKNGVCRAKVALFFYIVSSSTTFTRMEFDLGISRVTLSTLVSCFVTFLPAKSSILPHSHQPIVA